MVYALFMEEVQDGKIINKGYDERFTHQINLEVFGSDADR